MDYLGSELLDALTLTPPPTTAIDRLAPELLDAIFEVVASNDGRDPDFTFEQLYIAPTRTFQRQITNELRVFIKHQHTHRSALRALWMYYCKDIEDIHGQKYKSPDRLRDDVSSIFTKHKFMDMAIAKDLSKGSWITELVLHVPVRGLCDKYELKPRDNGATCARLPQLWDSQREHLRTLLSHTPGVRKLTLKPVVIPKRVRKTVGIKTVRDLERVPIPSSTKTLLIEDIQVDDRIMPEKKQLALFMPPTSARLSAGELTTRQMTVSLQYFTGCENVGSFHWRTPSLSLYAIDEFHGFESLKSLRIDVTRADPDTYRNADLRQMLRSLRHNCKQLTTLDLRLRYANHSLFAPNWPALLPRLQVLRVPLQWFPQAIAGTNPGHNITFELLMNAQGITQMIDAELKGFRNHQSCPYVKSHFSCQSIMCAKRRELEGDRDAIALIEDNLETLQEEWDRKREEGEVEGRHVELIDCDWYDFGEHLERCSKNWVETRFINACMQAKGVQEVQ